MLQPSSADVVPHATVAFSATVYGTADTRVVWAVGEAGGGSVDAAGQYTAPDAPGTYHVRAAHAADGQVVAVATINVGGGSTASTDGTGSTDGASSSAGGTGSAGGASGGSSAGAPSADVIAPSPPPQAPSGPEYFASPAGSGSACSASAPCSLAGLKSRIAGLARPLTTPVFATLQDGDYPGPLTLDAPDSGTDATNTVVWRAQNAGKARILGGSKVTRWTRLDASNAGAVWSRLHPAAKNGASSYVFFADLGLGSYPYSFVDAGRTHCDLDSVPGEDYGVNCPSGDTLELYVSRSPAGYACPTDHLCPPPIRLARYPNVESGGAFPGRNVWAPDFGGRTGAAIASPLPFVSMFVNSLYAGQYWTAIAAGTTPSPYGSYLFNVLEELDQPGEYWIDRSSGRAYLWPLSDADPSATGEVLVGTTSTPLAFASGSHHLEVRGVIVEGAQRDCVALGGTSNKLTYSTVRHCAANAITMTGSGHAVDHTVISNTGNDAIAGGAASSAITNSRIAEYGRLRNSYASALRVGATQIAFRNNLVHDGPWAAFYLGRTGFVAEYNDLSRLPLDGSDNGMTHAFASSGAPNIATTLRYNYWHDAPQPRKPSPSNDPGPWISAGIYNDNLVTGISIYGNVFHCIGACAGAGGAGRIASSNKNANVYRNNLVVDTDSDGGDAFADWSSGFVAPLDGRNNLFVRSGTNSGIGASYGSLPQSGTPTFVSTAGSRFANRGGIDLSNGNGRFSSAVFTTDPDGLDYIPWSSIGIR